MSNFLDDLAKWAAGQCQATKPRRKETLAAFLVVRENVREAMAAGYALKTIWEHMHETGRVSYRYETFLRHVRRHITNAPIDRTTQSAKVKPAAQGKGGDESILQAHTESRTSSPPRLGGFNFNPTPNKEDLY